MRHPINHSGVIFTFRLEPEWPNYEAIFRRLTLQIAAAKVVPSALQAAASIRLSNFAQGAAGLWLAVEQGGGEWLNAQSVIGLMRHPINHSGVIFTFLLESELPNYEATFMRLTLQMPAAEVVSSICKQLPRSGCGVQFSPMSSLGLLWTMPTFAFSFDNLGL